MAIMTKSQFTEKFGNDEHFAEWMDVIENSGDYAEMYSDTVYTDDGNKAGEYEERAEAVWKNGEMFINHYVHTEDVNGYEDEVDDCDEAEDAILTPTTKPATMRIYGKPRSVICGTTLCKLF